LRQNRGRTPIRHQGVRRTNQQRREKKQARETWARSTRTGQHDSHAREMASLNDRQDDALTRKLDQLATLEQQGIEAIRETLAREDAADRPPEGLSRLFQAATGAARRADLERQARAEQRRKAAELKIVGLKDNLQAERIAYARDQAKERARLGERQRQDDQQLRTAVTARAISDRAAEAQARHRDSREVARQREVGGREPGLS
jgi:hypothetical protein